MPTYSNYEEQVEGSGVTPNIFLVPIQLISEEEEAWMDHSEDLLRICKVFAQHGYFCSRLQAHKMWDEHSYRSAAGWLELPEDDAELFQCLESSFMVDTWVR